MATSLASLPTIKATLVLDLAASVSADIQTHWLAQRSGSPGLLATPIDDTATVLTLTAAAAGGLGFVGLAPGQTILIDGEGMGVIAVDGATVTVTRNVIPLASAAAPHDAGAAVYLLRYPDPWTMIADEALRPWAQQIVTGLGAKSATFGARVSGALEVATTE